MEKSDHYYLRRSHIRNLQAPTITEVREQLGDTLSDLIFSTCPDPLKPNMGLIPLTGAGDDLWTSPSDLLIGKVCLKPPLTSKHMKALTHQGILRIGRDVEIKFWNEAELVKQKALDEQEEMLLFMAGLEQRKAVEAARKEERATCKAEKAQMRLEFEARLKNELEQLEKRLRVEYEDLMKKQKIRLDKEWEAKLAAAVAETVARLTEQFLADLAKQEEQLLKKFAVEIKKEQIKCKMDIKQIQDCCQETFTHLKHQLECKNIANMMYILCVERKKCQTEREDMEASYGKQLQHLHDLLTEHEVEISRLTSELNEKTIAVNLREECLLEILRQFQKFISFALKASPTQGEFLLSVEKMMIFELTQALIDTDRKHAKRLIRTLFPWKEESEATSTTREESLIAPDHHECYNEIEPPRSEHSLKSTDYLAAFHYDQHMYVREEFRNMMSQGIKVSPSNLIWNRDVEHLMHILRRSVTSLEPEVVEEESVEEDVDDSGDQSDSFETQGNEKQQDRQPRRSVVYFRQNDDESNFLFPIFESLSNQITDTPSQLYDEMAISISGSSDSIDMLVEKDCCKPCVMKHVKHKQHHVVHDHERTIESAMPLIGYKNSLDMQKTRPQDRTSADYEGAGILCAQDSLYKHRMSLKPTSKIRLFKARESICVPNVIALSRKSKCGMSNQNSATTLDESSSEVPLRRISEKHPSIDNWKIYNKPSRDSSKHAHVDSQTSVHGSSRESKKHFRMEDPQIEKTSDEKHPCIGEKNIFEMSKLTLARDSYIIKKYSIISKGSKCAKEIPHELRTQSQTTIKINKKQCKQDTQDKTSLKKVGKHSYETQSVCVSAASSAEYPKSIRQFSVPTSKFTMSRDSLELLRSHTKLNGKRTRDSKESIEIVKDGILSRRTSPSVIKLDDDDGSRTVKMSHIEVLPVDDQFISGSKESSLNKHPETCLEFAADREVKLDEPWVIYGSKERDVILDKRDDFLTKPNMARIVGDQTATEHVQQSTQFTLHRASSLLTLFRKHPSLVKIFTPCTK